MCLRKLGILATSRSGHNWVGEVIHSWFETSVEGYWPDVVHMTNALPENIEEYGLENEDKLIIVIRDFPNFLASSLKTFLDAHGAENEELWRASIGQKIKAYKAILEYAMDPKKYYYPDAIISYQHFTKSRKYREAICKKLGGIYTEKALGFVSTEGMGSSWDKLEYQGRGQEMDVHRRCEQIFDTEWESIYIGVYKDNEECADLWVKWKNQLDYYYAGKK